MPDFTQGAIKATGPIELDKSLRLMVLPGGRYALGVANGSGDSASGVGLHAASHQTGGPDALALDSIPGTLDASKLTDLPGADIAQVSELLLGSYTIPMLAIDPGVNNRVIVSNGGGALDGIPYGAAGTVFVGGSPPTFAQITDAHVSAVAAIDVSKIAGAASDAELAAHEADTTGIHGITDTAVLAVKNADNGFTAVQTIQTTGTNAEMWVTRASGASARFQSQASVASVMTATSHDFSLGANSTRRVDITTGGHVLPTTDAITDCGNASKRWRDGYFDRKLYVAQEMEIDGPLNHDGTTAGVFGVAPATRTAAYTQAYATAGRTLAAYTADPESSAYTGAADGEAKLADLNALRVAYENLRAFVESMAGVVNSHTDDLQLYGWFQ